MTVYKNQLLIRKLCPSDSGTKSWRGLMREISHAKSNQVKLIPLRFLLHVIEVWLLMAEAQYKRIGLLIPACPHPGPQGREWPEAYSVPGHEPPAAGNALLFPEMVPRPVTVGGGPCLPLMEESWVFLFPEPLLSHHWSLLHWASS